VGLGYTIASKMKNYYPNNATLVVWRSNRKTKLGLTVTSFKL